MLFFFYHSITDGPFWMTLIWLFPLAISLYLIYAAYLVWFRFSPLAVRYICGALGFGMFLLIGGLFEPARDSDATWPAFVFLAGVVVVYYAYRLCE
jgi:hypothetical protein